MTFHPVAAVLATVVIAPLAVTMPIFGFAIFTGTIAAYGYLANGAARIRAERSFFTGREIDGAAAFRMQTASLAIALGRALAIAALALFTFPPDNASQIARNGPLAAYGDQMHAERLPTLVIVLLTIAIGTLATIALSRALRARAERWALYRLGLPIGLVFSTLIAAANVHSSAIQSVLPESEQREGAILYDPPETLAVLDAVRTLHRDLTRAEQKRQGLDKRGRECARNFWLDAYDLRERLNRAAWRCDEYRAAVDPVPIAQTAVLTMAVFDDLIDGLIADLTASVLGSLFPDGGTRAGLLATLAAILLSSNLLQGFVLAVYIAPLAGALQYGWPTRRRRAG